MRRRAATHVLAKNRAEGANAKGALQILRGRSEVVVLGDDTGSSNNGDDEAVQRLPVAAGTKLVALLDAIV